MFLSGQCFAQSDSMYKGPSSLMKTRRRSLKTVSSTLVQKIPFLHQSCLKLARNICLSCRRLAAHGTCHQDIKPPKNFFASKAGDNDDLAVVPPRHSQNRSSVRPSEKLRHQTFRLESKAQRPHKSTGGIGFTGERSKAWCVLGKMADDREYTEEEVSLL